MLAEPQRQQLDSIVRQMISNKESDANIQTVVNDFTTKYNAPKQQEVQGPQLKDTGSFGGNLANSAGQFAKGIGNLIAHPIDTAKTVGGALVGAGEHLGSFITGAPKPTTSTAQTASQIGSFYKERYGSFEKAGQTLYQDPVGALADASVVAGGAGAGLKAGGFTQAGSALSKVGAAIDPINAVTKPFSVASQYLGKLGPQLEKANLKLTPAQQTKLGDRVNKISTMLNEHVPFGGPESRFNTISDIYNTFEDTLQNTLDPVSNATVDTLTRRATNSLSNSSVGVKPGAVERAIQEIKAGNKPPVKVRQMEDGSMFIEDGRHHLEAAKQLGLKDYPIENVTSKYGVSKNSVSREALTNQLRGIPDQFRDDTAIYGQVRRQVEGIIKDIDQTQPNFIPAASLNVSKRSFSKKAFDALGTEVRSEVRAAVSDVYKTFIEEALEKTGTVVQVPPELQRFFGAAEVPVKTFNQIYGDIVVARHLLKAAVSKPQAGALTRLITRLVGGGLGLGGGPIAGAAAAYGAGALVDNAPISATRSLGGKVTTKLAKVKVPKAIKRATTPLVRLRASTSK